MTPQPALDIADDSEDLADRAAIWLATRVALAPARIAICLSGGATPKRVYEMLGGEDLRARVDWRKVHLFWGDERFVPKDHEDSNFRMAWEAMIRHVPIPDGQIHPIPTDAGSPEAAAALYDQTLRSFYGADTLDPRRPLFDVTLLGLGADGHIASLFPGSPVLDERKAWAVPVIGAKPEPRITLTYPALESSGTILFLVSGAQKREALAGARASDPALPASRLAASGMIRIIADRDATEKTRSP
ncbi:6-phosphogluconolactonase [Methylocapsa acidiphila]|uniref:6-phosphogluconolactonase n=1 Tax=Methylocapsa acidiphila TaxID=133552 RepID=UPI0004133373|nr:6-phosphogluconolactonase [Methylocapsa acidiphila]